MKCKLIKVAHVLAYAMIASLGLKFLGAPTIIATGIASFFIGYNIFIIQKREGFVTSSFSDNDVNQAAFESFALLLYSSIVFGLVIVAYHETGYTDFLDKIGPFYGNPNR